MCTFNSTFSLSLMLGATSETEPSLVGGQRFTSINPDLVLTYTASDNLQIYVEIYGQSKTAPRGGSGFNADAGVTYLLLPKLEIDIEVGQRISGDLDGFNDYIGTGMSMMF